MPHRNSTIISNLSMTDFSSFITLHPLSSLPVWITLKQFLWSQFLPASQLFLLRFLMCVCVLVCLITLHEGSSFPDWEWNPHPLHWDLKVLTIGPPGESHSERLLLLLSSYGTPFRIEGLLGTKPAVLISTSFFLFSNLILEDSLLVILGYYS